jgi:hypothetical protein
MPPGHDMRSLQYAPSPRVTLVPVGTIEFRFGVVNVCIDNGTVGAHRDHVVGARFTRGDGAGFARANVVVRGAAPLFAVLVEPGYENRLLRFFG